VVNKIFSKIYTTKDLLITSLPFQQQLLLITLFTNIKRTDALLVTFKELIIDLKWVCDSIKLDYSKKLLDDGLSEL
jgi:hypothetical protein